MKGFADIIVCPHAKSQNFVFDTLPPCQKDHRHARRGAQLATKLKAVLSRKVNVQESKIAWRFFHRPVPVGLQKQDKFFPESRVVFYYQYSFHKYVPFKNFEYISSEHVVLMVRMAINASQTIVQPFTPAPNIYREFCFTSLPI